MRLRAFMFCFRSGGDAVGSRRSRALCRAERSTFRAEGKTLRSLADGVVIGRARSGETQMVLPFSTSRKKSSFATRARRTR